VSIALGLALAAYGITVGTVGSRLLRRSTWPDRSPRLGMLAWLALTISVVISALFSGAVLVIPEVPISTNLESLLRACAFALHNQYSTPGGALQSVTGALVVLVVLARGGYYLAAGTVTRVASATTSGTP
jgi:hypothetical protein